jgi:HSP20 family molecular chaperone IbpA
MKYGMKDFDWLFPGSYDLVEDLLNLKWLIPEENKTTQYVKYYKEDKEDSTIFTILLPGLTQEQIGVEYKEDVNKKVSVIIKEDTNFIKKTTYDLYVKGNVDSKNIKSVLKNGVLIITVPKVVIENKEIKIEVK